MSNNYMIMILKDVLVFTKKDMAGRDRMVFILKNINIPE